MALYLLLLVSTYARPNKLLRIVRGCLVPPSPGVTSEWSLLLNPEEAKKASKTGADNEIIYLNSRWMRWVSDFYKVLREGDLNEPVFRFSYPQFGKHFNRAQTELQLNSLVPYQTRHSGPSIDRSSLERDMTEVQKR